MDIEEKTVKENEREEKETPPFDDAAKETKKKTLSAKLRYKGKYELLPEKELRKQLRFYEKRHTYKYAAYIGAIPAIFFAILALKYNTLLSLLVVIMIVPGIFYSIMGAIKVRRGLALIFVLGGLVLNLVALFISFPALVDALPKLGEIFRLIGEYIKSAFGQSPV